MSVPGGGENPKPEDEKKTDNGAGQDPKSGNQSDDKDDGKAGDKGEKTFTQAELDAAIEKRLSRERERREAETARAKADAEAEAAKKNGEFQKLAETLEARVKELEPKSEAADRYKTALTKLLETERQGLPSYLITLLDKMDPAEQIEWLAENRAEVTKAKGGEGDDKDKSDANKGRQQTQPIPDTPRSNNGGTALTEKERSEQAVDFRRGIWR